MALKDISVTDVSCDFLDVKFKKTYDGQPIAVVIHKQEGWVGGYLFCVLIIDYQSNHQGGTYHVGASWCVLYVY